MEKMASGSGPVSFTLQGRQVSIPLSALYFDARGHLNADRWPGYANLAAEDKQRVAAHLSAQALSRRIVAGQPLPDSGKADAGDRNRAAPAKTGAAPANDTAHEPETVPETLDSPAGDAADTGSGEELPGTKSRRSEK